VSTLSAWWLGELDASREAELEEHFLGCETCSARLRDLMRLAEGIKHAARTGDVAAVVTDAFIRRLQASGVRVREYRLEPGGSVNCTVAPDDDLVVAHLGAPLQDVQRLDMVVDDLTRGIRWRARDVAFDPATNEVVMAPSVSELRQLTRATLRVQLVAMDRAVERVIGNYTFNHSRYEDRLD
jgi:hypothetical protein